MCKRKVVPILLILAVVGMIVVMRKFDPQRRRLQQPVFFVPSQKLMELHYYIQKHYYRVHNVGHYVEPRPTEYPQRALFIKILKSGDPHPISTTTLMPLSEREIVWLTELYHALFAPPFSTYPSSGESLRNFEERIKRDFSAVRIVSFEHEEACPAKLAGENVAICVSAADAGALYMYFIKHPSAAMPSFYAHKELFSEQYLNSLRTTIHTNIRF